MSNAIELSNIAVDLKPAPINPKWVVEGRPAARNAVLSKSRDKTASTLVWDCTAGTFDWFYDVDETIHILEGSVVLKDAHTQERRLGPGDVVFFPAGAQARWKVDNYVRKLAFFRRPVPKHVEFFTRKIDLAKTLARGSKRSLSGLMKGGAAPAAATRELSR